MAQATLVEARIDEGQHLLDRLAREGVVVTAAAWVKESESGDWYLYLATPLVTEGGGKKPAYHRVNAVMREMRQEGFGMDPFAKKVIGSHDPIAKDMVANRSGRPAGPPTSFRGNRLGNLAVEEAYLYPRPPTPEEMVGMQLWACGQIDLRPGIGPAGLCRVVMIDIENQVILLDQRYRGTMANPRPLSPGQLEATWAEGGALRIVGFERGSPASQRWRWSQPRISWEESGFPPDKIRHTVLTAMSGAASGELSPDSRP